MSWNLKNRLKETLASEEGASVFAPGAREPLALIYPNEYRVGMANLGMHIIYRQINSRGDVACERFFLPDKKSELEYRRANTPLLSVENQRPLYDFALIAFTISFEMDYFNIIKILSLGKVPALAAERGERGPLIILGGPCATFNPEPLADVADACVIGEGEEIIGEILDAYGKCAAENASKEDILLAFSQIGGLYVPKYYRPLYQSDGTIQKFDISPPAPQTVKKRYVANLADYPGTTVIKAPDVQFQDMYLVETARGCGRHCRFCMAGHCFLKPRSRPLSDIAQAVKEAKEVYHYRRVGLVGAAVSDHPQIDEICRLIRAEGLDVSAASLRADSLSEALVAALAESGHKTITLAPEAGSERLRRVINKNLTDAHLSEAVAAAAKAGIHNVRLYIMIGLPGETDEDIAAIATLAKDTKSQMEKNGGKGTLTLSVNPFVPKPFTPFQWLPMAGEKEVLGKIKKIKDALRSMRGIKLIFEPVKEMYVQAALARGDRRLGAALLATGGEAANWKKALREKDLDENFYLYRLREQNEIFPWDNLDMGFSKQYLYGEYLASLEEKRTPPCFEGCRRCGVCG